MHIVKRDLSRREFLRLGGAGVAGAFLLGTAACGGGGEGTRPDTLAVGIQAEPVTFDPYESTALVDRLAMSSLYDKLVEVNSGGELEPMLAEDWEISEDQTVYTLRLREGVEFHDDTPFDAEAVKFNLDRYLEEDSARSAELAPVESVEVMDPMTVELRLSAPFSPLLSILADRSGMMVSPTAVEESGGDFANNPVGSGPFRFVERIRGDSITVERFEGYWRDGMPELERVVYQGIEDPNVQLNNLRSGQLDVIDQVPVNEIEGLASEGGYQVFNEPELGYQGIWLNTTRPPFDDVNLRRAVYTLVDREAIVNVVLRGTGGVAGNSPFAPVSFAHGESDEFERGTVEQTRELLREAGQPDGFSFTMTVGTSPENQQLGQVVQEALQPAGIQVELERVEFGTLLEQAERKDFDALQLGWSGRIDPDQNIYEFLTSGDPSNYSGYSNERVDELLLSARREGDEGERKRLYDEAMEIIHDEAPYIYLYHENSTWGLNESVQGFEYNPDGVLRPVELSKAQGG